MTNIKLVLTNLQENTHYEQRVELPERTAIPLRNIYFPFRPHFPVWQISLSTPAITYLLSRIDRPKLPLHFPPLAP